MRGSDKRSVRDRSLRFVLVCAIAGAGACAGGGGGRATGTAGGGAGTTGAAGGGGGAGTTGGAGGGGAAGTTGAGGGGGSASAGTTGAGGAGTTGAGGGVAGTSGSAGDGRGGAAGAAGATGAAGAAGAAGSIGGAGGRGGAAGAGGAAGPGGAAGSIGGSGGGAGSSSAGGRGGAAGSTGGGGTGGEITLDPTPGSYLQICDGSLAVMFDATHFLDGNDEQQGIRVYARGASAGPLQTIDVSAMLGLSTSDEADFEDAARVGSRVFVIGSHGRNKSGKLDRARYRFFALDVGGAIPAVTLTVPGYTTNLLDQMLVSSNWATPDTAVLAALNTASNLGKATDASLAPLAGGTNIEGLAWAPTAARPKQLLIGFRSPIPGGKAIVVSLLNADAVVTGVTAQFGEAAQLDLGGLGIRGMAWSPLHAAVLLIGGPLDDSAGPFRLFRWSGAPADAPVAVQDITGVPSTSAPEAIVTYANTRDVQILFDQGDHDVGGGVACKDADTSERLFGDAIIHVP
jgi:hypothetical protein